jgi:hypothetical protein
MLTSKISPSCPPSLAPPAASTRSSAACYSTTLIGRARSSSGRSAGAAQPRLSLLQARDFLRRSREQGCWAHNIEGSGTLGQPKPRPFCPLSSARPPTPSSATPLASHTTAPPPPIAHRRASRTLLTVAPSLLVAFLLYSPPFSAFALASNKRLSARPVQVWRRLTERPREGQTARPVLGTVLRVICAAGDQGREFRKLT